MELELPPPCVCRPYAGPADHQAMADSLNDHCAHAGNPETTTLAQFDNAYANLVSSGGAFQLHTRSASTSSGTKRPTPSRSEAARASSA